MIKFPPNLRERIESKFIPEPNSGCFIWVGALSELGYAMLSISTENKARRQKQFRAHRLYYELERGPIPEGLVLDHLCRVRCCVNPYHLEPVTSGENVSRGGRSLLTVCPQGHPYSGRNLIITKSGDRKCRECDRARASRYHHANKEKSNARRSKNYRLSRVGVISRSNASKTHCKHGHEFTTENTYVGKSASGQPTRQCKICTRLRYEARLVRGKK